MTLEDAAGSPSEPSSSKRLSYVPYQRKAHQRSVSGASQVPVGSPEPETRFSHPAANSASATHRPNSDSTSSSRRGSATADRLPTSSTPLRPQASSPRTPSALSRPAVTSPIAYGAGLVRPHRDLDAPPPPLRVASKLASSSSQSTSNAAAARIQATGSSSQAQSSIGSASSISSSSANRHDRSQSTASTTTLRAADRPISPQKLPETPRNSSRIQPSGASSTPAHSSARESIKPNDVPNGGTPISASAASSIRGSSKASSALSVRQAVAPQHPSSAPPDSRSRLTSTHMQRFLRLSPSWVRYQFHKASR